MVLAKSFKNLGSGDGEGTSGIRVDAVAVDGRDFSDVDSAAAIDSTSMSWSSSLLGRSDNLKKGQKLSQRFSKMYLVTHACITRFGISAYLI